MSLLEGFFSIFNPTAITNIWGACPKCMDFFGLEPERGYNLVPRSLCDFCEDRKDDKGGIY